MLERCPSCQGDSTYKKRAAMLYCMFMSLDLQVPRWTLSMATAHGRCMANKRNDLVVLRITMAKVGRAERTTHMLLAS